MHPVLEARLVTPNGFSISLMSEWIENPLDQAYDKQDCERKAFTRLATRLKQAFPRWPILILADGLYPYEGFFATCKAHNWRYIVTFKEGNLPTIWEEVRELQAFQDQNPCLSAKCIHSNRLSDSTSENRTMKQPTYIVPSIEAISLFSSISSQMLVLYPVMSSVYPCFRIRNKTMHPRKPPITHVWVA